ncbi:MAG: glycosyltransferase family 4 protein [Bacteroidota bacterium]
MKILIVSQYFWPENFKINDLCSELVKLGHDVTVITGKPNYPKGKFFQGYGFFSPLKDDFNGVEVFRLPVIPRGNGSGLMLSLNYLSFVFFGCLFSLFHKKKYDFSFTFGVSPITSALPAVIHRIFYKTKMVLWVQDLWPESVEVTIKLKSIILKKALISLVKFIYKQSDKIFISSQSMEKSILEKLESDEMKKISYLPNWAEDIYLENNIKKNKYSSLMPKGFKIMFAGNIGWAQDFPSIVKAAQLLKKNGDIKFIILGDGSEKDYLLKQIKEFDLGETIYYLGSYPLEEMANFYFHADMMLLTLRDELIYSYTVPSKLQGYLAAKKPVAAMVNGETAEIIKKSKCGVVVDAGDTSAFVKELLKSSKMPASLIYKMEQNGFEYYKKTFTKEIVINSILQSFE